MPTVRSSLLSHWRGVPQHRQIHKIQTQPHCSKWLVCTPRWQRAMLLTVVLNLRVPLCKLWVCLSPHTCTIQHDDNCKIEFFINFLIDAMVRPPCENGQVNSLINELLVHVGLIKVNSINLWTFLGTNFWELLIVWSCMIVYIIVGGQEIQASERYQRPNFGSEACGQARLLPSKFSRYTHRLLNEVSAKFIIEEVNTE